MAMAYGNVYVAQVAFGAKDAQTVKAFLEAEAYPGPSLIIAYSHCIAHGYDMAYGLDQQKLAVESGLLAALPLRPAPGGRRASRRSCSTRRRRRPRRQATCDESALPLTAQQDPERFKELVERAQQRIQRTAARSTHELAKSATPKPQIDQTPMRSDNGPDDELPRLELPHPLHAGRLAARRRPRHRAPARGRRRRGHRDALAVRGADRAGAVRPDAHDARRTTSRPPRRCRTFPRPTTSRSGPTVPRAAAARIKQRVGVPVIALAQRHDAPRAGSSTRG